MKTKYRGTAIALGDHVDTDTILPGKYLATMDPAILAAHCLEPIRGRLPPLSKNTVIVAGRNFGCGSSREGAPVSILGNGMKIVIAESFARIFYRNAVNIGLLPIECSGIRRAAKNGDMVETDLAALNLTVNGKRSFPLLPPPPHIQRIISAGGLVPLVKKELLAASRVSRSGRAKRNKPQKHNSGQKVGGARP